MPYDSQFVFLIILQHRLMRLNEEYIISSPEVALLKRALIRQETAIYYGRQ